jgi:hypothetical protein
VIQPDLRPLGAGEILDRAVTLFVRHFWPLVLILALVVVPLQIISHFVQPSDLAKLLNDYQRLLAVPAGHPEQQTKILREMSAGSAFTPGSVLVILIAVLVSPLATTACAILASVNYRGGPISVLTAYRQAVRRWFAQVITTIVFIALYIGLVIAIVLIMVLFVLLVGMIAALSQTAGLVVGIPLGLAFLAVALIGVLLLYFAWELATVSIAIEEPDPGRAIGRSFRRTLGRGLFWRSVLAGLILVVVTFGGALVVGAVGGILAVLTHLSVLVSIFQAIASVVINALLVCYLVVYLYDVRVRREGYDLSLASQAQA